MRLERFLIPTVQSVMSSPVDTIKVNSTVSDAIDLMMDKKIGSLVVISQGKPVGIFTRRDLFNRALNTGDSLKEIQIRDVISSPVVTVNSGDKVNLMIKTMRKHGVTRAVVMDGARLAGILTETDIRLRLPRHLISYKSIVKRYVVDTIAYILFWSGITVVIQVFIVGISLKQFVASSLLGFIVTVFLGGIYGRFLDLLRSKFKS